MDMFFSIISNINIYKSIKSFMKLNTILFYHIIIRNFDSFRNSIISLDNI